MKTITLAVMTFFALSSFAQGRTMSIQHMSSGPSYFEVNVQDRGPMNGKFAGWCADWNTRIEDGVNYESKFWSSLSPDVPTDVVAYPENLDEVNWLINQKFVGKTAPDGMGVYTIGDVQLAIWTLIDDEFNSDTVGEHSQARVDYLVMRARTDGANYQPRCRELVGIILLPTNPDTGSKVQNTIILVPRYKFKKCVVPDTDTE